MISNTFHLDYMNWEKIADVSLESKSTSWKDTLVFGRHDGSYYMYIQSTREIEYVENGSGYGGKKISEMRNRLIDEYAEQGITLNVPLLS